MEKERKQMSEEDISQAVAKVRRTGKFSEETLSLMKSDYLFGLSKEEVDIYVNPKYSIEKMKIISDVLRKHNVELAKILACEEADIYKLLVAVDFYEKGVPIDVIREGIEQGRNANALKNIYQKVLDTINYAKENRPVNYYPDIDELYKRLEEKDILINSQQDNIQQANAALARARKEVDTKDKEMRKLQESMEELKKELADRQRVIEGYEKKTEPEEVIVESEDGSEHDEVPKEEKYVFYGIPVQYAATVQREDKNVPEVIPIERSERKSIGIATLLGKLAFKRKSKQDIVRLVAEGGLEVEQLQQIRNAMERGLRENQLLQLINNHVPANQMKEIIEIAVLENNMEG